MLVTETQPTGKGWYLATIQLRQGEDNLLIKSTEHPEAKPGDVISEVELVSVVLDNGPQTVGATLRFPHCAGVDSVTVNLTSGINFKKNSFLTRPNPVDLYLEPTTGKIALRHKGLPPGQKGCKSTITGFVIRFRRIRPRVLK